MHGLFERVILNKLCIFKITDEIWAVNSQENHENYCHQMSDFKAKMQQNRFRLRLRPRSCWELTALPRSPSWNKGDLLLRGGKGARERKGEKMKGKARERRRKRRKGEGKGRDPCVYL